MMQWFVPVYGITDNKNDSDSGDSEWRINLSDESDTVSRLSWSEFLLVALVFIICAVGGCNDVTCLSPSCGTMNIEQ